MSTGYSQAQWLALLDGELPPVEAARFEASLPPAARERLSSELRLEAGISDRLSAGISCPDLLWARVRKDIERAQSPAHRAEYWKPLLAAAAVIICIAAFLFFPRNGTPSYLRPLGSVAEAKSVSQVGTDLAEVQAYLAAHQINLQLSLPPDMPPHRTSMIGAREQLIDGVTTVALLYDCCGFPATMLLVPLDTSTGQELQHLEPGGDIQALRRMGDHIAVVVSEHPARGLVDLLHV